VLTVYKSIALEPYVTEGKVLVPSQRISSDHEAHDHILWTHRAAVLFRGVYSGNKIKEDEMGETCGMYG
jgi:hypothetical protein